MAGGLRRECQLGDSCFVTGQADRSLENDVFDDYRALRVQLTALSDEVLAKLKALGFKELAQAKSVKLVIGTIHVDKLEALAKLDVVRRVEPSL